MDVQSMQKLFGWTFKIKIIEKSQLKHKNKYDYSNGMYINCKTKVKIICIIHGEFEQVALNHMKGHGCVLCAGDQLRSSSKNWYNYDDVCYVQTNTHVIIKCPDHGKFIQTPASHLIGHGCPHCCYKTESMVY